MKPFKFLLLFPLYSFILLLLEFVSSSSPHKIPRLSPHYKHSLTIRDPRKNASKSAISSKDSANTYFYNQTLDHFNYGPQSYATFQQKYIVNLNNWGGANFPIFAYLGAEEPLIEVAVGIISDIAPSFKALEVYIEHRFYGDSVPFGTMIEAMKNDTLRGYFNSAQAIADYAEVLLHIKEKFGAQKSPIIVIGGSYGGMLASWFRLKYPHIALGALASSAPILYFDNITPQNGYFSIVTKVFKETSISCYQTIKESWSEIDKVASKPNGLSILSRKFRTCSLLKNSDELKDYLEAIYANAAQYNEPWTDNYVGKLCKGIDGAPKGTDILGRIFAGVVSMMDLTCYNTTFDIYSSEINLGWTWQSCSEMVIPIGSDKNDTMFQDSPFNLSRYAEQCKNTYGVSPRPHWVTTYYGGHDIKLALGQFGSNIIFSNGRKDPFSSGGVLEDISESIVAVTTLNGSHCLDILSSAKDDPEWLIMQRNIEIRIIKEWIQNYYADLQALKK